SKPRNSSARSSATPIYRASRSRSSDDSTFNSPTTHRPRRPPSQSLCNDHTGTVVTEVPRRPGQPPRRTVGGTLLKQVTSYRSALGSAQPVTVSRRAGSLDQLDVGGLRTLVAGLSLVGNLRALGERTIAPAHDR